MANVNSTRKPTTKQPSLISRVLQCTNADELAALIKVMAGDGDSIKRLTRNELDILQRRAQMLLAKPTTSEGGAE